MPLDQSIARILSDQFMYDLKEGHLHLLLKRIWQDHTLMLAIRNDYINIYYRGGSILKLSKGSSTTVYNVNFNNKYLGNYHRTLNIPDTINNSRQMNDFLAVIPLLKESMDLYFGNNGKENLERETQQIIVRENNYTSNSAAGDYYITDIEYALTQTKSRSDLIGFKWLRTSISLQLTPVLIELKYGDSSVNNHSGIIQHLRDMELIACGQNYDVLCRTIESQLKQLCELKLIKLGSNREERLKNGNIIWNKKPAFIFIFANHNPRSMALLNTLNKLILNDKQYDLRFFLSSFGGYTMYDRNMADIKEFAEILRK